MPSDLKLLFMIIILIIIIIITIFIIIIIAVSHPSHLSIALQSAQDGTLSVAAPHFDSDEAKAEWSTQAVGDTKAQQVLQLCILLHCTVSLLYCTACRLLRIREFIVCYSFEP